MKRSKIFLGIGTCILAAVSVAATKAHRHVGNSYYVQYYTVKAATPNVHTLKACDLITTQCNNTGSIICTYLTTDGAAYNVYRTRLNSVDCQTAIKTKAL